MEEIKTWILRIHLDDTTVDYTVSENMKSLMNTAEKLIDKGVWVGNKLYPSRRIVHIEIV